MRKAAAVALALLVVALAAACGSTKKSSSPSGTTTTSSSCTKASLNLVSSGKLTIGTDNPAYPPWYAGGAPKGS